MASPITDRIRAWGEDWIKPVYAAIYRGDSAAAQQASDAALNQLAATTEGFTADEALAVRYWLVRASYHTARLGCEPAGLPGILEQTLAGFAEIGCNGPISSHVSNRFHLELLIAADRDGSRELSPDGFSELFNRIPAEERTAATWYAVSTWCFDHRQVELLGEAYEVILLANQMDLKQFPFRRIKLMHQLVGDRARVEDITHYLDHLEFHNAFEEFERFFLPVIAEKGLATAEVQAALDRTRERFAAAERVSPY